MFQSLESCELGSHSAGEKHHFKSKARVVDDDVYSNVYIPPRERQGEGFPSECEPITGSETTNNMDFSKMNVLNKNVYNDFSKEWGKASIITSGLTQAYNNPYLEGVQIASQKIEEQGSSKTISSKSHIISLLKRLKSFYIDKSLSNQLNHDRLKKFNILISYFTKSDNDSWQINNKGAVIYNNVETGIKFAKYVDYFIKTSAERSGLSKPLYYDELFNVKIMREKAFSPMIQKSSSKDNSQRNELDQSKNTTSSSYTTQTINDEGNNTFKRDIAIQSERGDRKNVSSQTKSTAKVSKHTQKEQLGQSVFTQTYVPETISTGSQKNDDVVEKLQRELSLLKQIMKTTESELKKQIALNISLEELNSVKIEESKILRTLRDAASQTTTTNKIEVEDKFLESIEKAEELERTESKLWDRIEKLQKEIDSKNTVLDV